MRRRFHPSGKQKVLCGLGAVLSVIVGVIVWHQYPFGVKQYKTITLGMRSAEKAGDATGWAPPDSRVPEESGFYVYALGDEAMCIGSSCGIGGYFVECLGGWISGYKGIGDVSDYGLRDAGVDINKQKVITIADKHATIVGIYPGVGIKNLPLYYAQPSRPRSRGHV